jgi:hypothetical protein
MLLKQHITFPETKSIGEADNMLPQGKEEQNKLLDMNFSHISTLEKTIFLILAKQ